MMDNNNDDDEFRVGIRGGGAGGAGGWGGSRVSWVGRTIKPCLATFLGEGKL